MTVKRELLEDAPSRADKDPHSGIVDPAAFNPATGRLIIGDTENERQSVFLLFKGANGIFRNPVAHKYIDDEDIAALEIVCVFGFGFGDKF